MMKWMAKLEYKFGKYAIKNLTLILIALYVVGYILQIVESYTRVSITPFLYLNPYAIAHGQVWRILSWLFIPPNESNFFFTLIMLFFYFSIGRTLEKAWGDFQYNVYIFLGMLFTVAGSFLMMAYVYLFQSNLITAYSLATDTVSCFVGQVGDRGAYGCFETISQFFSTYYINMSIFLAYATTFPDNQVMLLFIIPIRVKILGFIYGGFLAYEMISQMIYLRPYNLMFVPPFVVGASLLNFLLFFLTTRNYIRMSREQRQMHKAYEKQAKEFKRQQQSAGYTKHKCAVCQRTEKDDPQLTFRYCSKCEGNYEYCQDHLYTHIHFTGPKYQ